MTNLSEISKTQPAGIIFDLDGTLYTLSYMKLRMALQLAGTIKYLRRLFRSIDAVRDRVYDSENQLMNNIYMELSKQTGTDVDAAAHWYNETFMIAFVRMLKRSAVARQGVVSLLEAANRKGVALAVVSDFGMVAERLEAIGIAPSLFSELHGAQEFGALKPEPDSFLGVARKWGIEHERILVVGDRDDRDGECARRAGMEFLGIADKSVTPGFYRWRDALQIIEDKLDLENAV